MDVEETMRRRKSVRRYLSRPIEKEKIVKLIEAARLAPSASNRQEWRFVVVRDRSKIEQLAVASCNQSFIKEAPLVIVACAQTDSYVMRCGQLCYPIDVAIACEHIVLEAVELGLGSCWIGAFYEEEVKKILNIPSEIRIVELLALGYPHPEETPPEKKRLSLDQIAFGESWHKPLNLT